MNCKLNCPAWGTPYAEALLVVSSWRLLTTQVATEVAAFQRLCELVVTKMHRADFAPKLR